MCMASPAILWKRSSCLKLNEFSMKKSPNVANIQRGSEVKLVCWLMVSWSFSLLLLFNNLILFTISCFYGIMRHHYTSLNEVHVSLISWFPPILRRQPTDAWAKGADIPMFSIVKRWSCYLSLSLGTAFAVRTCRQKPTETLLQFINIC